MYDSVLGLPHDEVEDLLLELNFFEKINNGEIECMVCGETLSIENIGVIYPKDHKLLFSCDKLGCIQKMTEMFAPLRKVTGDSYNQE